MTSQWISCSFSVLLCLGCSESAYGAPAEVLIPNPPLNRPSLRSPRFVNPDYVCKHGYVDLRQVPALTFLARSDAKRTSDLVGGIRQLQCSNCQEFGKPERATCVNERFGESEASYPLWTCTADFKMRGITIDQFDIDCIVDRASYFQNCVREGSCILRISASPGYLWGYVLAVTFFVAVIGILVFFGVRHCIERTRLRKDHSLVPSEEKLAPPTQQSSVGANLKDLPFIDDSEELPTYDQVATKPTP